MRISGLVLSLFLGAAVLAGFPAPGLASHDVGSGKPVITLATIQVQKQQAVRARKDEAAEPIDPMEKLLNTVAKEVGVTFEYLRVPWARALRMVRDDTVNGTFFASFKPERTAYAVYPMKSDWMPDTARALKVYSYWLYSLKSKGGDWDGTRLVGNVKRIGAERGTSIIRKLKGLGVTVVEAAEYWTLARMLVRDRFDAFAGTAEVYRNIISRVPSYAAKVSRSTKPLEMKYGYLIFSRPFFAEHPDLAERIWDRISIINKKH
ncbi:MAG: hypothetical protein ISR44_10105 [Rhodospirillales bacterium]|nr:hypothetical protein [Rhodospirillales bacterium]